MLIQGRRFREGMSFQVSRIRRKNEDSESQIEQQLRSWDVRTRYHRMPRIPGVGSELSEVKTDAVCCLLEQWRRSVMIPNSYIR